MVYCVKFKDGKCSYTNGKCIIKNPKTIDDYAVCPQRKLAKDYDEMTMEEKAFHNSIENKKKIEELEVKISKLETEFDFLYNDVTGLGTRFVLHKHDDKKKGGFWSWLKRQK